MNLGEAIKLILKERNMNQIQLSEKVGKSQTAISQILNGAYSPTAETMQKIAEALDVPVAVISFLTLSEEDVPENKKDFFKAMHPIMEKYISEMFINKS